MKIIVRVRELRKTRNLTQEELARNLNISRQSLISLEQGRWLPSLPLAMQLAAYFNAPLEQVICTSLDKNTNDSEYIVAPSEKQDRQVRQDRKEENMSREILPHSPFRELRDEMDRLFEQSVRTPGAMVNMPSVNISQDENNIYLDANVSGFSEEQIDIDVADDYVIITGNIETEENEEKRGYVRREYQQQSFTRTVGLPLPIRSDDARAKMERGILHIVLPKVEEEKPKMKRLKPTK